MKAEHSVWHVVRAAVVALGLCGMVWLTSGCGGSDDDARECTLIGTIDGLVVEFDANAAGEYWLELEGDGVRGECVIEVGDTLQVQALRCEAEQGTLTPQGLWVQVLDEDGAGPAEIKLSARQGARGVVLFDERVRPNYVRSEPNGPGCGESVQARATVPLRPTSAAGQEARPQQ